MREYVTIQGDAWDMIALRVYGNEKQMHVLIEANPEHRETVFFSANVKLKVPPIEVPVPLNLPPWRRKK